MKPAVLIIAPPDDAHALSLAAVMDQEFGVPAVIWDRGTLPTESQIDFRLDGPASDLRLDCESDVYRLNDFRSVWWRRAAGFRISKAVTDPKVRDFCSSECDAFFKGVLRSLDIPIINDPFAESVAARKPYQLAMARKVGLDVPKTLMSNSAERVRAFWEELEGNCIYKPFTAPAWTFSETRMMTQEDVSHLDTLRHAPIIVQEKIEKGVDVRVNIFGDAVFAAEVSINVPQADLDWRIDSTAEWRHHNLPDTVGYKLKALLKVLRLQYGCIDMRQQPDGGYRFFEVNPSGQFLFAEIDTGQPLLRALAEVLVDPVAAASPPGGG
ncbi:MAG: MvdC/MvdD family ATP grasp protein [Candidatus Binataceae bacterium]